MTGCCVLGEHRRETSAQRTEKRRRGARNRPLHSDAVAAAATQEGAGGKRRPDQVGPQSHHQKTGTDGAASGTDHQPTSASETNECESGAAVFDSGFGGGTGADLRKVSQ